MTETKTTEDLKGKKTGDPAAGEGKGGGAPAPVEEPIEDKTPIESLPEDTQKYIKNLRQEAKDYRLSARETSDKLAALEKKFEELTSALEEKSTVLEKYTEKEKEAKLAEASELEKLQIEIGELKKSLEEKEQQIALKDGEVTVLKTETFRDKIAAQMDSLINEAGYKFLPYQRAGLLQKVLELKEDGTYKSSKEVEEIVKDFIEENKETPPSPPGGGGKEKTTQVGSIDELRELTKLARQRKLTTEEYARLNELQAELNKAMGRTK